MCTLMGLPVPGSSQPCLPFSHLSLSPGLFLVHLLCLHPLPLLFFLTFLFNLSLSFSLSLSQPIHLSALPIYLNDQQEVGAPG